MQEYSTAMTSFEGIEKDAISNDRAWKGIVTNYCVENDFRKVGDIDRNLNWILEYYLCKSIDNPKMWIIAAAFLIGGNRHSVLRRSDSNVTTLDIGLDVAL